MLLRLLLLIAYIPLSHASYFYGAGATFPYPLYEKWAEKYKEATGNILSYKSVGSGAGIKAIKSGTVTFGATDEPMAREKLEQYNLVQFPTVIGGIVPVVNLKETEGKELNLTGEILADIFLGKITHWDDSRITDINPSLSLPHTPIQVIHRKGSSGTSFLFTTYLSNHSGEWKEKFGAHKQIEWPVGLAASGNDGIAETVKKNEGSIGYVQYNYAQAHNLAMISLQSKTGNFVTPSPDSFLCAAQCSTWKDTQKAEDLIDVVGPKAWPITGATYVLMNKVSLDPSVQNSAIEFFAWAFEAGDNIAAQMGYIPLPKLAKTEATNQLSKLFNNDETLTSAINTIPKS